ncbi:MAG TPA: hypothetical protein VGA51_11095 [Casimicrobiaceae bacterium]
MIQRLQQHALPIVIAVAFYVSGFFAMANVLTLNNREIVLGLVAGTIGGLTVLIAVLVDERRSGESSGALT